MSTRTVAAFDASLPKELEIDAVGVEAISRFAGKCEVHFPISILIGSLFFRSTIILKFLFPENDF